MGKLSHMPIHKETEQVSFNLNFKKSQALRYQLQLPVPDTKTHSYLQR